MLLGILFLVIIGICGTYASCPPSERIYPCTCDVITDKVGDDFAIVTCEDIQSVDLLMHVLDATRGQKLFEFQLVNSILRYIPHDAFHDTTFEVVNIENSTIFALSDTDVALDGLQDSLRLLEIVNCSFLTEWHWNQLSHLRQLMEIVAMQTHLLDITNGLCSVEHLELEAFVLKENNIELLDNHVFSPFKNLTRVTLDKNLIQKLERTMFPRPAKYLKILGLSHNKLTQLPADMFIDMPALTSLYLTGNPLQTIDEVVFRPVWDQLQLFFFYDTRLSCDCRLAWIMKTDNTRKFIHAVCSDPEEARGRHLQSIQQHELWCRFQ